MHTIVKTNKWQCIRSCYQWIKEKFKVLYICFVFYMSWEGWKHKNMWLLCVLQFWKKICTPHSVKDKFLTTAFKIWHDLAPVTATLLWYRQTGLVNFWPPQTCSQLCTCSSPLWEHSSCIWHDSLHHHQTSPSQVHRGPTESSTRTP